MSSGNRTKRGIRSLAPNWLMTIPLQIIQLFLIIIPTIIVVWLSITNYSPILGVGIWKSKIIWAENYVRILQESEFISAVSTTAYTSLVCISAEFLIGLFLALIFSGKFLGRRIFFMSLIVPMMIAPIVVGNNFWLLFNANGPVNQVIGLLVGEPFFRMSWFTNPKYALLPIMLAEIWHWYPLSFLILLSGLTGIPTDEIRAAEVLGASSWQMLWRVKLPKLKKVAIIALVIRGMESTKIFDIAYLLTGGGPGTVTENFSLYMFKYSFTYSRISYVSAGAWIILVATVLLFSFGLRSVFRRE